jgi:hypothetical protein
VQAATGLPVTLTPTSANCAWRTLEGDRLATSVVIRNPAPQTVPNVSDIRARFLAHSDKVVDRPELGPGVFEVPDSPPAGILSLVCDVYKTASNGKTTDISVGYSQGPAKDVCRYAEEVAMLVP